MTHDPHDALVKSFLTHPEHVLGLLQAALPRKFGRRVDWQTLKLCSSSFIDRRARQRHGDLLFSARMRGTGRLIYVLLEHQSTRDRSLPWRAYRYHESIWTRVTRARNDVRWLPLIITVVLYHGRRPWRGPLRLSDLFDTSVDDLDLRYPPVILIDLWRYADLRLRRIGKTAIARLVLFCLKHARSPSLLERLSEHADLLRAVWHDRLRVDARETFIEYILMASRDVGQAAAMRTMAKIVGEESQIMAKTIGEKLIERGRKIGLKQGREEGREEGQIEGQRALVRQLIMQRFGKLPVSAEERLARASAATLSRVATRVLTARTLAEALAD